MARFCHMALACAVLAVAVLHGAGTAAATSPSSPSSSTVSTRTTLSVESSSAAELATKDVLELQRRIDRDREYATSLNVRIQVMTRRLFRQRVELSNAKAAREAAEFHYRERLIRLYKNGTLDPVVILVSSSSFTDLVRKITLLTRLTGADRDALVAARLAERDAAYRALVLQDMTRELRSMRSLMRRRVKALDEALRRRDALVRSLNSEGRGRWRAQVAAGHRSRQEWRASSIASGRPIRFVPAVVEPYAEVYLIPEHQPKHYRTTGAGGTAVCSWYGNEFDGRPTASGQIFNEDDFTCAHKSLPFGTRLALRRGDRRIVVVVNDRGPFVAGRDIDLSKAAARALGFSGVEAVHYDFVKALP